MLLHILIFALINTSQSFAGKAALLETKEDRKEEQGWKGLEEMVSKVVDETVVQLVHQFEIKLRREKAELEDALRRSSAEIAMLKGDLLEEKNRRGKIEARQQQLENSIRSNVKEATSSSSYALVCVYQLMWDAPNSVVTYDRITSGFNSNGDGLKMDIESGAFTIITSGHYMITFSGHANVHPGQTNEMFIYVNDQKVEESLWVTMGEYSGSFMIDQGSRTLVSWSSFYLWQGEK